LKPFPVFLFSLFALATYTFLTLSLSLDDANRVIYYLSVTFFWGMWDTWFISLITLDGPCGLVVRVLGDRFRGPGFDSRPYQIFWEAGSLERGPLSLVRTTEKLLEWESRGSGLENRD
jgi:hypothetical protein